MSRHTLAEFFECYVWRQPNWTRRDAAMWRHILAAACRAV